MVGVQQIPHPPGKAAGFGMIVGAVFGARYFNVERAAVTS